MEGLSKPCLAHVANNSPVWIVCIFVDLSLSLSVSLGRLSLSVGFVPYFTWAGCVGSVYVRLCSDDVQLTSLGVLDCWERRNIKIGCGRCLVRHFLLWAFAFSV
eukprot:319316-Amphidinium_carterae.1